MFKTVLVPVDLNDVETAKSALAQAVMIAQGSDASVRLIHVRSDIPRSAMEFVPPNFDAKQFQGCEDKLADLAAGPEIPDAALWVQGSRTYDPGASARTG